MPALPAPRPLTTAYTISLGTPEEMAQTTSAAAHRPLLKIKLGGEGDEARIAAVRRARWHSRIQFVACESRPLADRIYRIDGGFRRLAIARVGHAFAASRHAAAADLGNDDDSFSLAAAADGEAARDRPAFDARM